MENKDDVKEKGSVKEKENSATDVLGALVKQLKTMWIVIVLLILLLVGTNMAWLYVFQSYDYVTQDGAGQNYFNSNVKGSVYNGTEGESKEIGQEQGN